MYEWILVDRVRRVTGGFIGNEQGAFRARRGCVDQIFTLKQIGDKARGLERVDIAWPFLCRLLGAMW